MGNELNSELLFKTVKESNARMNNTYYQDIFKNTLQYRASLEPYMLSSLNIGRAYFQRYNSITITDVNIIVPNKVVQVTFADGTKEKSVCSESDVFSLEQAISICITKKLMGGSSNYNKAVKVGMKVYQNKVDRQAADFLEQERVEQKRAKKRASRQRRLERLAEEETQRLQAEREEMIEIQKEAYKRAMTEVRQEKKQNKEKGRKN